MLIDKTGLGIFKRNCLHDSYILNIQLAYHGRMVSASIFIKLNSSKKDRTVKIFLSNISTMAIKREDNVKNFEVILDFEVLSDNSIRIFSGSEAEYLFTFNSALAEYDNKNIHAPMFP